MKKLNFLFISFLLILTTTSFSQNLIFHLLTTQNYPSYTWTGEGTDALWSNPDNWLSHAVPGVGDVAHFIGTACSTNCSPSVDINVSIKGIVLEPTFTGTITQLPGQAMIIGASGWIQEAGTFLGGSSQITINSQFRLMGGQFASTSDTLLVTSGFQVSSGNFIHNNGRLRFDPNGIVPENSIVSLQVPVDLEVWNLQYSGGYAGTDGAYTVEILSGSLNVLNDFQVGLSVGGANGVILARGGAIKLKGNLIADPAVRKVTNNNPTQLVFDGLGTQKVTSTTGRAPAVIVNKTSGTVEPEVGTTNLTVDSLTVSSGSFTAPSGVLTVLGPFQDSVGGYVGNSGSIAFERYAGGATNVAINLTSAIQIQNLSFGGGEPAAATGITWQIGGATPRFNLAGNLSIANTQGGTGLITVQGAEIYLAGNYSAGAYSGAGVSQLIFNGSGAQSFSKTGAGSNLTGTIRVEKPSGILTLATPAVLAGTGQDFSIINGTVNLSGFALNVADVLTVDLDGSLICNGGVPTYASSVILGQVSCGTTLGITWTGLTGDNQWTTAGNWTNNTIPGVNDLAIFNSQCVGLQCNSMMASSTSVKGLRLLSDYSGTVTAGTTVVVGTSGYIQAGGTFQGSGASVTIGNVLNLNGGTYIASSGTTTLTGRLDFSGSPTFVHSSGTFLFAAAYGINSNFTVGNQEFFNVRFGGDYNVVNLTGTMIVNGLLSLEELNAVSSGFITTGTVLARGDVQVVGRGRRGTALIRIGGSTNQTVTGNNLGFIPSLEIASTGGDVTLVGTLIFNRNYIYESGNVITTGSTLRFPDTWAVPISIKGGPIVYDNVEFTPNEQILTLLSDLNVGGDLILGGIIRASTMNGFSIAVQGDVALNQLGMRGTTNIKLAGSTDQTLTSAPTAHLPSLEFASTGGTIFLVGTMQLANDLIYTSGVVDAGTSTIILWQNWNDGATITPGPVSYYNFSVRANTGANTFTGPMTILGTLTLHDQNGGGAGNIIGGPLLAYGDVIASGNGVRGTALVKLVGTSDQLLIGNFPAYFPSLEIASTGGVVYLNGRVRAVGDFTYSSGTINPGSSTLEFTSNGNISITGTPSFNNVSFAGGPMTRTLTGTLQSAGVLLLGNGSTTRTLNGGTLSALGDVVINTAGTMGTATLTMQGATSTVLSRITSSSFLSGGVTVNKSGSSSVILGTDLNLSSSGQDLTVQAGVLDLSGGQLIVQDVLTIEPAGTLLCKGGSIVYGSLVNNGNLDCGVSPFTWTGLGGDTLWDNPANWSGGVVPGVNDLATFSGDSGSNSTVLMNTSINVKGIRLESDFTGSLTQASGVTITTGDKGWYQNAGSFFGGDSSVTLNGNLTLNGGLYRATSGLTSSGFNFVVNNAPTFEANGGHFHFTGSSAGATISAQNIKFHQLTFAGSNAAFKLNSTTVFAQGILTLGDSVSSAGGISNGTLVAEGDLVVLQEGYRGNAELSFRGAATATITIAPLADLMDGKVQLQKQGTLQLGSAVSFANIWGQNFEFISGALDLQGYNLTTHTLVLSQYTKIICRGGNYTYNNITDLGANINCGAYQFNWTGAGADSNWSTAANWSGGVVPNNTQVAYFSSAICGANCNAVISSNMTVGGIVMTPDYTGTITQNPGATITVGSFGWTQSGGTFLGSNAAITVNRNLSITSGTFRATSDVLMLTMPVYNDFYFDLPSTVHFQHNEGTLRLSNNCSNINQINTFGQTFKHVRVYGTCSTYFFNKSEFTVLGDLTFEAPGYSSSITDGVFKVHGNVTAQAALPNSGVWGGNFTVELVGNPLGQIVSGPQAISALPKLVVNTGSNPVTFTGNLTLSRGFDVISVDPAQVTQSAFTLRLHTSNSTSEPLYYSGGLIEWNKVFVRIGGYDRMNLNNQIFRVKDLTIEGTYDPDTFMDDGIFEVSENLQITTGDSRPMRGSVIVKLIGNPLGQTVTGVAAVSIPNLEIATGIHPVIMAGQVGVTGNTIVTSGSPDINGASLVTKTLSLNGNTLTKSGGTLTVNGVTAGTGSLFGGTVNP